MIKVAFRSGSWFWFILIASLSFAQTDNDLYLFSLQLTSDGHYHIYAPKYLSGFNEEGYTIQPSFTSSGDLLVSVKKAGENQYDIWQLSPSQKIVRRLTLTNATEFSPQITPDGQFLSVLRKMPGEELDQQVCIINLHSQEYKSITSDFHNVGNYTWMSADELGLYRIEGKDNRLSHFDIKDNKIRLITTSVGKTLSTDKNGFLVYVHEFDPEYWYIKKYNPESSHIDVVAVTPDKAEEFALAPDGTYFMGKDHILYAINPEQQSTWDQIADLSIYDIHFINGIAISRDGRQLALVATEEKP